MIELKMHVERIVRPIRASGWRKNKMREELLSHLAHSTEEELKYDPDEREARLRPIQRLGDVAALRRELQACVPAAERFLFTPLAWVDVMDRWFDRREGESPTRYALERTVYTTAFIGILMLFLLATLELARALELLPGYLVRHAEHPFRPILVSAAVVVINALATFLVHYLVDVSGVRRTLSPSGSGGSVKKAAALGQFTAVYLCLFLTPTLLFVCEGLSAPLFSDIAAGAEGLLGWLAVAALLLVPLGLLLIGRIMVGEREQYERWGRLQIIEE